MPSGTVKSFGAAGVEIDQAGLEVVPAGLELEDEDDDEGRNGQRQRDLPEQSEVAGAVDAGRLEQLARQAQEELALQEDVERRAEQVLPPQRHVGAEQAECLPDQVCGTNVTAPGQHHRGQHQPEEHGPAGEAEVGEAERHEGARDRDEAGREQGDDDAVDQPVEQGQSSQTST